MLMLLVVLAVCALFGVLGYAALGQMGVLPGDSALRQRGPETLPPGGDGSARPLRRYGTSEGPTVGSRLGALPQGCLVAVLVFAAIWFAVWGVVLVLALRILTSPY